VPPDDFFDEDWEEPSQPQDTAITRPAGGSGAEAPQIADTSRSQRPPRRPRPGGRRPVLGGRRPPGGGPQVEYARLAVLGVGIVVVLLLLWFVINFFTGGSSNATDTYLNNVAAVAGQSEKTGTAFHKLLITPGLTPQTFTDGIGKAERDAQAQLMAAEAIKPTNDLQSAHGFLVLALRYRLSGLQCMSQRVSAAFRQKNAVGAGGQLSHCARELLASDVIYSDSFAATAQDALQSNHVSHTKNVPTSRFVKPTDSGLVLAANFGQVILRIKGALHGLHGMAIASTIVVTPGTKVLTAGGTGTVKVVNNLAFTTTVTDSGNFQEVGVQVVLTLQQQVAGSKPLTFTKTIPSIAAQASTKVVFGSLFSASSPPAYNHPYTLRVRVTKVPGEHTLSNNRILTTVNFLLGS
jgi:hypothetical protein